MLRRFSINFAVFSMALDVLIIIGSLRLITFLRPTMSSLPGVAAIPDPVRIPPALFIIFPVIWVGLLAAFSVYDGKKNIRIVDELAALTISAFIAGISMAGVLYLSYREVSRALFLAFFLLAYLVCILWRAGARLIFRLRKEFASTPQAVLVVGKGKIGAKLAQRVQNQPGVSYHYKGYLDLETGKIIDCHKVKSEGATLETLAECLKHNEVSDLMIALPHTEYSSLNSLVEKLEEMPLKIWVALDFYDLALHTASVDEFAGIPMLDLRAPALSDFNRIIKRVFDLVGGFFAMIISLPFMVITALLVLIFDGWPILFCQKRVGENGRLFKMLKFRTMVRDADKIVIDQDEGDDKNHSQKRRNDPRVTRLGAVLRRLSLDELPQFINVLAGDMSLVGPRPELPHLVEQYEHWQRARLSVPPGITGWWQVNGRSDRAMYLHVEDDLYYINHYSIWLDLQILIQTVWVVIIGKGAF